jgi:ankyrin repeat protein
LAKGANIEAQNQGEETALELAANNGQLDTVKFLLSKGANPVTGHVHTNDDLLDAAGQANANKLELLLELGIDINSTTDALFKTAESEPPVIVMSPEELKRLGIPQGTIEEAKYLKYEPGDYGNTVRLLLEHGAKIDGRDEEGATPLIRAAAHGSNHVVQALLEHGAGVDARDKYGNTALVAAACEFASIDMPETLESLRLLLDKGADVNARDHQQGTALMAAAPAGRTENAKLLLHRGAQIDARDRDGNTALLISVRSGQYSSVGVVESNEMVKLLLARGADIEARDRDGNTPLILASSSGGGYEPIKVVEQLLKSGADVRATNKLGQSAIELARKNHRGEIVTVLSKALADPE